MNGYAQDKGAYLTRMRRIEGQVEASRIRAAVSEPSPRRWPRAARPSLTA
jgi:DNA-binding FrmR family transcriptional regulator